MDPFQAGAELLKLLGAALLGFVAKLFYDRRFSKRPDLRYDFERPATFGAGDRARIYQNFRVTNTGTDTATDVRIAFKRPALESSEHQVQFDGELKEERTEDQVLFRLPTLLPDERVLFSFVIAFDKTTLRKAEEMLVSVRAANCLGRAQAAAGARRASGLEWLSTIFAVAIVLSLLFFVGKMVGDMTGLTTEATISMPSGLVANRGQEIAVEAVVRNRGSAPLVGFVSLGRPWPPSSDSMEYRNISVAQGAVELVKFTVKVPEAIPPGTYALEATVLGKIKAKNVLQKTSSDIEVK